MTAMPDFWIVTSAIEGLPMTTVAIRGRHADDLGLVEHDLELGARRLGREASRNRQDRRGREHRTTRRLQYRSGHLGHPLEALAGTSGSKTD